MNRTTTAIAALGAAGVIGLAALPVVAQEDTTTATESDDTATDDDMTDDDATLDQDRTARRAELEARAAKELDAFAADLAAELGLDQADVSDALTTVMAARQEERDAERQAGRQERLDAAVEDGTLTQDQADGLAALEESGDLGRGHHGPGMGRGMGGPGSGGLGMGGDAEPGA